jgi:hypothetical protein
MDFTDLQLAGVVSCVNISAKHIRCTKAEYALKYFGATLEIRLGSDSNSENDI